VLQGTARGSNRWSRARRFHAAAVAESFAGPLADVLLMMVVMLAAGGACCCCLLLESAYAAAVVGCCLAQPPLPAACRSRRCRCCCGCCCWLPLLLAQMQCAGHVARGCSERRWAAMTSLRGLQQQRYTGQCRSTSRYECCAAAPGVHALQYCQVLVYRCTGAAIAPVHQRRVRHVQYWSTGASPFQYWSTGTLHAEYWSTRARASHCSHPPRHCCQPPARALLPAPSTGVAGSALTEIWHEVPPLQYFVLYRGVLFWRQAWHAAVFLFFPT
jgi:hypothetical protein